MATDKHKGTDTVSVDEAVRRLMEADTTNANKINELEKQIDEMVKKLDKYRDETNTSVKSEFQTMSEQIESNKLLIASYFDETKSKIEDNKHQWSRLSFDMDTNMNNIMDRLDRIANSVRVSAGARLKSEIKEENDDDDDELLQARTPIKENVSRHYFPNNDHTANLNLGRTLPTQPYPTAPILGRPYETAPSPLEPKIRAVPITPSAFALNGVKHSIIIPPSSASPAFYGKHTESPTQFLIRVQEYAESVHAWDRPTLLNGISQFLRESALEWYCQLRQSHRRPETWTEFTDLFLAQFNSPVRKARQEKEWHECKQKEDETINEFLIRLRALWREQKPRETEADLSKHLFCRMRNDLLNMIGVSRNATLDEIITEVQQIEEILYRRAKNQRLVNQSKPNNNGASSNRRYNENYSQQTRQWANNEYPTTRQTRENKNYQVNEVTPNYYSNRQSYGINEPYMQQQMIPNGCYLCGDNRHWARDCPNQYEGYRQERNKTNSKNIRGALDERTSRAPM